MLVKDYAGPSVAQGIPRYIMTILRPGWRLDSIRHSENIKTRKEEKDSEGPATVRLKKR